MVTELKEILKIVEKLKKNWDDGIINLYKEENESTEHKKLLTVFQYIDGEI